MYQKLDIDIVIDIDDCLILMIVITYIHLFPCSTPYHKNDDDHHHHHNIIIAKII